MNHHLEAYVSESCFGCDEARAIAEEMSTRFPNLHVEVINLDEPEAERPPAVFAVPTFLLNGELLWLGNPPRDEAVRQIAEFLKEGQQV